MHRSNRRILIVALKLLGASLLLQLFFPVTSGQAAAQTGYENQTIMVYMIGSDLEARSGAATRDIGEMIKARANPDKVRVLIMTGGSTTWHSPLIPTDCLSLFEIKGNQPEKIDQFPLKSMGEKETLTSFLDYTATKYPSDSYGLVLWDHGGGPMVGFGVDDLHGSDGLTLLELQDALRESVFGKGLKLEWIGFDACLMSTAEVAYMAADHANFMIASQETLPNQGWDYSFLKDIADTDLRGPEVAEAILSRTFAYYEAQMSKRPDLTHALTLSCLNLAEIGALESALDALFEDMDTMLEVSYSVYAQSRDLVKSFGVTTTSQDYDLIDMADLADQMSFFYPDKCEALLASLDKMVVLNQTNQACANGVSLYYPFRNKEYYRRIWQDAYSRQGFAKQYTKYMKHFGDILLADSLASWAGTKALQPVLDEKTWEYFLQLTPEQAAHYDKAYYYLLVRYEGEEYFMYHTSSDITMDDQLRLTANFDGKAILARGGHGKPVGTLWTTERDSTDGISQYQSRVIVNKFDEGRTTDSAVGSLLITLDKANDSAKITGFILDSEDQSNLTGKRDADLLDWDLVIIGSRGRFLTRDPNGDILPFSAWHSSDSFRGWNYYISEGFDVFYGRVEEVNHEMFCLIEIIDTQGNRYSSELMPVSGTKNAVEEIPPMQAWTPQISITLDDPATSWLLHAENGLTVELLGAGFDKFNKALQLTLRIKNDNAEELRFNLSRFVLNNKMVVGSWGDPYISANSEDVLVWKIHDVRLLKEKQIEHINRIDFELSAETKDLDDLVSPVPVSLHVNLDLPVTAGMIAFPVQKGEIFTQDGLRFQITEAFRDSFSMKVLFDAKNESNAWNLLKFDTITLNGVPGFQDNFRFLAPGTSLSDEPLYLITEYEQAQACLEEPALLSFFISLQRIQDPKDVSLRRFGPFVVVLDGKGQSFLPDEQSEAPALPALPEKQPFNLSVGGSDAGQSAVIEREGFRLIIQDLHFDSEKGDLILSLAASNCTDEPIRLLPQSFVANQVSLYGYGEETDIIPAGEEVELAVWLANTAVFRSANMDLIRSLSFDLSIVDAQGENLMPGVSFQVEAALVVPPQPGQEVELPIIPGQVIALEDAKIEFLNATQDEYGITANYRLDNLGNSWDYCNLEDVSVNGYAGFYSSGVYARPGTSVFGNFNISSEKLKDAGIDSIAQMEFYPKFSRSDLPAGSGETRKGPCTFRFAGEEVLISLPDEQGKTVLEHSGVTLIQLDSDPSGLTFLYKNDSDTKVHIQPLSDHLWNQGVSFAYFSQYDLPPGQHSYTQLHHIEFVPEYVPSANGSIEIQVMLIDVDSHRLLHVSDAFKINPNNKQGGSQ